MPRAPGVRFRPPPTTLPPELEWLLQAAFADGWGPPPRGSDVDEIARLAAAFDLGPRIVARRGAGEARRHLGPIADPLVTRHRQAVAATLGIDRVAGEIAAAAARQAIPVLFLKGYAIGRAVEAPPGARPYGDLDVLVPPERAPGLAEELAIRGFRSAPVPANEQHLAPLVSPLGLPVDLHFRLRGVSLGGGWATADEILAAGLCSRLVGHPGEAWLPAPRLLAAHALVHGLDQHGYRPAGYPLLRMVADLLGLVPQTARWEERLGRAAEWIRPTVSAAEAAAAFDLAAALAAGRLPRSDGEPGALVLLEHIVAGTLSPRYRASLRFAHTAARLRAAVREGHLLRYISRKLTPGVTRPPSNANR